MPHAVEQPIGIIDAGKIELMVKDRLFIKNGFDQIGSFRRDDRAAAVAVPAFRLVAEIGKMFTQPIN